MFSYIQYHGGTRGITSMLVKILCFILCSILLTRWRNVRLFAPCLHFQKKPDLNLDPQSIIYSYAPDHWLCKHMKKFRSSQASISINSCIELSITHNQLLINDSLKKLLFNAVIKSQFSYCPLVVMFYSKQTSKMINKLHERALRIVLNNHISNFETLLQKSNNISCHQY